MDLANAVKERIKELYKERGITLNKLATLSGMPQSTLDTLINGPTINPKLLTILRICLGLNMELKDFFDSPLFKDLSDE